MPLENYTEKEILTEILLTMVEIKDHLANIKVEIDTIAGTNIQIMNNTLGIANDVSTILLNQERDI